MAVISSEEVRGFAQHLRSMVASLRQKIEGVQSSAHQAGEIWDDTQYEEFSAQLDALCASLTSFYDEARVYATNLEKKAARTDVAGGHGVGAATSGVVAGMGAGSRHSGKRPDSGSENSQRGGEGARGEEPSENARGTVGDGEPAGGGISPGTGGDANTEEFPPGYPEPLCTVSIDNDHLDKEKLEADYLNKDVDMIKFAKAVAATRGDESLTFSERLLKLKGVVDLSRLKRNTRSRHRRMANRELCSRIHPQGSAYDEGLATKLNSELPTNGKTVSERMRCGSGKELNPPGCQWHHPDRRTGKMDLFTNKVHSRSGGYWEVLHPNGEGGFVEGLLQAIQKLER